MNLFKRHTVLLYFLLTFLISWGGIIFSIGGFRQLIVPTDKFDTLLPLVILAVLAGPSLAGILATVLSHGKDGLKEYKTHLFRRTTGAGWYAIALLVGPLIMTGTYLVLALFSDKFIPSIITVDSKIPHVIAGLMTGLFAGFFEEIGWTGFAIPQLRKKYGVLAVGLIVGLLWALWHTLPGVWIGYGSGTVTSLPLLMSYFADSFLFLVIYRVLMVWVYDKTKSLFVAMIMHGSLTATARIITPIGIVGIHLLVFDLLWMMAMIFFVAVVLKKNNYR
jgi:uncharacterized protein